MAKCWMDNGAIRREVQMGIGPVQKPDESGKNSAQRSAWFRFSAGEAAFVLVALLFMAILSIGSIRSESLTYDELVHIPAGLAYWQKHDTRLNVEHPPLLKMIATVPLLFANVNVNYDDPSWCGKGNFFECEWEFGKKFISEWNSNPQRLIFLARLPMIFTTLALAFIVYLMARSIGGFWGGALSLILFVSSPFYLGLGGLVITDIGLPLFVLAAAWAFGSVWSSPNYRNVLWFSLAFAGAMLSKFSAVLLLPTFVLVWLFFRLFPANTNAKPSKPIGQEIVPGLKPPRKKFAPEWYVLAGIILGGAFVYLFYVWACGNTDSAYLFEQRAPTYGMVNFAAVLATHASWFLPHHPLITKLLNPVWLYLSGVLHVASRLDRRTYLLGKAHLSGVWYYFPTVAFFKLTPAVIGCSLLLTFLFVFDAIVRRGTRSTIVPVGRRRQVEALIGTLIVFTGSTVAAPLNLGIRHISVPISILLILCALIIPLLKEVKPPGVPRMLGISFCGAFAVSAIATALLTYPHYISYYNAFRLETAKQEIANGSNLDWGQSLMDLERFRSKNRLSKIYVDSETIYEPELYVSGAVRWRCNDPEPPAPAWIAVSANYVVQDASLKHAQNCTALLRYPHRYIAGETMLVINITGPTNR